MNKQELRIGSRTIQITNPDKVLFPDDGITKGEFIDYYRRIAEVMIPHIKDRPISMNCFPDGIAQEGFYQQAIPENAPEWIDRVTVKKVGGSLTHMVCNTAASLVYLANLACITPHIWLSRLDEPENPDQMIFDLDPAGNDFAPVREGAGYLKSLLDEMGLISFIKTTGSRGVHVVIPITRSESFDTVRSLAQNLAEIIVNREPSKFTTEQRKEKRKAKLYIDTLRNAYAHTAVAPYAVRALTGAPVAAPIFWDELKESKLTARSYNIHNIFKRLKKTGDPWKDIEKHAQSLSQHRQIIQELLKDSTT